MATAEEEATPAGLSLLHVSPDALTQALTVDWSQDLFLQEPSTDDRNYVVTALRKCRTMKALNGQLKQWAENDMASLAVAVRVAEEGFKSNHININVAQHELRPAIERAIQRQQLVELLKAEIKGYTSANTRNVAAGGAAAQVAAAFADHSCPGWLTEAWTKLCALTRRLPGQLYRKFTAVVDKLGRCLAGVGAVLLGIILCIVLAAVVIMANKIHWSDVNDAFSGEFRAAVAVNVGSALLFHLLKLVLPGGCVVYVALCVLQVVVPVVSTRLYDSWASLLGWETTGEYAERTHLEALEQHFFPDCYRTIRRERKALAARIMSGEMDLEVKIDAFFRDFMHRVDQRLGENLSAALTSRVMKHVTEIQTGGEALTDNEQLSDLKHEAQKYYAILTLTAKSLSQSIEDGGIPA